MIKSLFWYNFQLHIIIIQNKNQQFNVHKVYFHLTLLVVGGEQEVLPWGDLLHGPRQDEGIHKHKYRDQKKEKKKSINVVQQIFSTKDHLQFFCGYSPCKLKMPKKNP